MKTSTFLLTGLLSLVGGGGASRSRNAFRLQDDSSPVDETARVTAFVLTDEGIKVECWELQSLSPPSQSSRSAAPHGSVRRLDLGTTSNLENVYVITWPPDSSLIREIDGTSSKSSNGKLFTVKDGLISVELGKHPVNGKQADDDDDEDDRQFVFADVNGDDWFYFEDQYTGSDGLNSKRCTDKSKSTRSQEKDEIVIRTVSGSDTTLVQFNYQKPPPHKVLHHGRCNFAGLRHVNDESRIDRDAGESRFLHQDF